MVTTINVLAVGCFLPLAALMLEGFEGKRKVVAWVTAVLTVLVVGYAL